MTEIRQKENRDFCWREGGVPYALRLLVLSLVVLYPQSVLAGGIGFRNFRGNATVINSTLRNNFTGIQSTVTDGSGEHSILI